MSVSTQGPTGPKVSKPFPLPPEDGGQSRLVTAPPGGTRVHHIAAGVVERGRGFEEDERFFGDRLPHLPRVVLVDQPYGDDLGGNHGREKSDIGQGPRGAGRPDPLERRPVKFPDLSLPRIDHSLSNVSTKFKPRQLQG